MPIKDADSSDDGKVKYLDYSVDYMKPHGRENYIELRVHAHSRTRTHTHTTLNKGMHM